MKKTSIVLLLLCTFFLSITISAQGLYSEDDLTVLPNDPQDANNGVSLREDLPGGGGQEPAGTPIGEGLLILTALAGGYAVIKKRKSGKKDSL